MQAHEKYLGKRFLLLLSLLLWLPSQAQESLADKALKDALDDTYYELIYSPAFAKRFGLNEKKAEVLPPGVEAVELEVRKEKFFPPGAAEKFFGRSFTAEEKAIINKAVPLFQVLYTHKWVPYDYHYDCYLNLYVKGNLKLAYPDDGDMGSKALSQKIDQVAAIPILANQTQPSKWRPPSYLPFAANYDYKAFIVTSHGPMTMSYTSYFKQVIYDMTYIRLGPDKRCEALAKGLNKGKIILLLEKAGGTDYQPQDGKRVKSLETSDFYRISLPQGIITSPLLKKTLHYESQKGTLQ